MSQRGICRCPLCQLEKRVISQLEQEDGVRWFQGLTAQIASLRGFGTIGEVISYAHSAGHDPERRRVCDGIYVVLLRELPASEQADLVYGLLLRMVAPGLHKELRGMMLFSYPGIDREDVTQQWITKCFEIMRSPGILRKTSYLAASIIEWTKRDMYRWAGRQYVVADKEQTHLVIDDIFEAPRSDVFESEVQLHELLKKGVADGIISADDVKLLTAYEIEGMSGEELGERAGLDPKALSHRVRRAIARLQRAFKKSAKGRAE